MADIPPAVPDPLRAWREATGGSAMATEDLGGAVAPQRRPTRLFALAGGVCALTLVLAVAASNAAPEPPGAAAPVPVPSSPSSSATAPGPTTTAPASAPAAAPAADVVPAAAAATAVLSVRKGAAPDTYVDTAVVDGATAIAGVLIVTVRALVLRRVARGWDGGSLVRYAVPVDGIDGSVLASAWRLPTQPENRRHLTWTPLREPALTTAAVAALQQAGYRLESQPRLRRSSGAAGVVSAGVEAVAPGERAIRQHDVWLTADARAVVGTHVPATPRIPVPQP